MTDQELDEILTYRWPMVVRRVMADGSDEWAKGFVRSIARHGKRPSWRPSQKQAQIMRRLVTELGTANVKKGRTMKTNDWQHISEALDDLVVRVRRLGPDHYRPERFHEEKSEIAHDLQQLRRVLPAPSVYGCARPMSSTFAK